MPQIGIRGMTLAVGITLFTWLVMAISAVALLLPKNITRFDRTLAGFSFGTAIIFVTLLLSPNVVQSFVLVGRHAGLHSAP